MSFNLERAWNILLGKAESWLESLIAMLPNVVVAILVLIIFYVAAKAVRAVFRRIIVRISDKSAINNLFATIVYLSVLGLGLIMALNVLHLEQTVTSLLAGAGIVGLALGFAFQDITANFISGILLAIRKPIEVGDIIQTEHFMGSVEKIDLRVTIVRTFQGLHVIIPNKHVLQSPVTNFTKTYDRRIDLDIGVSYAEDLEHVQKIAIEAVSKLPYLLPNREINAFFKEFGDSSINFTLMLWKHYPDEPGYLRALSDAIIAVKKAFDRHGITIPFPIRTLDFGIKGGQTLSEMEVRSNANYAAQPAKSSGHKKD